MKSISTLLQFPHPVPRPPEQQNPRLMRSMFSTVAPRYNFITRAFSYGMDSRWKREAVENLRLPERPTVLDLASGTGDFSALMSRRSAGARVIAVDLTERMLWLARRRGIEYTVCADAATLPFADATFDCVFVGYGLRNFPDLARAVAEIERVTRPGGALVSLEFFLPSNWCIRQLYLAYLYAQGVFWGIILHGRPRIYTYIPDSLKSFVSIDDFSSLLRRSGYSRVSARRYILGGIGLHFAAKESSCKNWNG
jgi:demethylmenaquinone methyltransferase/2-methoxy-6-polyprenyl-1,4-benzoquinol methylase